MKNAICKALVAVSSITSAFFGAIFALGCLVSALFLLYAIVGHVEYSKTPDSLGFGLAAGALVGCGIPFFISLAVYFSANRCLEKDLQ